LAARLRSANQKARPIRVLALDLDRPFFRADSPSELAAQLPLLHAPATALMDRLSRADYGFDLSPAASFPQAGELNGQRLEIVGTFVSGRDFAHSGNLFMSLDNFRRYFRHRGPDPLQQVDLGLLKLDDPTQAARVVERLQETLGLEAEVLTRQAFIEREIEFWDRNTPIGAIFTIGTVMGFVVGVIICYQVLANAIADHLAEFATLKAMGYPNRYFIQLTIRQSLYLAWLGFLPGVAISWGLFQYNAYYTALPMSLTVGRVSEILLATMAMCLSSGVLALRKLFAADPASLF
jgi:putative ABC transport system permease protein